MRVASLVISCVLFGPGCLPPPATVGGKKVDVEGLSSFLTLASTEPAQGAINVATSAHMVLTFDRPVNASTVQAGVSVVLRDSHAVAISISAVLTEPNIMEITPVALIDGELYTLTIEDLIGADGALLEAPAVLSFTTQLLPLEATIAYAPTQDLGSVEVTGVTINLAFNRAVTAASLASTHIKLTDAVGEVPVVVTPAVDLKGASLTFSGRLRLGAAHQVQLSGITDANGRQAFAKTFDFKTRQGEWGDAHNLGATTPTEVACSITPSGLSTVAWIESDTTGEHVMLAQLTPGAPAPSFPTELPTTNQSTDVAAIKAIGLGNEETMVAYRTAAGGNIKHNTLTGATPAALDTDTGFNSTGNGGGHFLTGLSDGTAFAAYNVVPASFTSITPNVTAKSHTVSNITPLMTTGFLTLGNLHRFAAASVKSNGKLELRRFNEDLSSVQLVDDSVGTNLALASLPSRDAFAFAILREPDATHRFIDLYEPLATQDAAATARTLVNINHASDPNDRNIHNLDVAEVPNGTLLAYTFQNGSAMQYGHAAVLAKSDGTTETNEDLMGIGFTANRTAFAVSTVIELAADRVGNVQLLHLAQQTNLTSPIELRAQMYSNSLWQPSAAIMTGTTSQSSIPWWSSASNDAGIHVVCAIVSGNIKVMMYE